MRVRPSILSTMLRCHASTSAMPRLAQLRHDLETTPPPQTRRGPIVTPHHPYIDEKHMDGAGKKVFYETYGCQMNVSDMEIVRAVLQGVNYTETKVAEEADIHLIMTCSIREKAEAKIWTRINTLREGKVARQFRRPLAIGILGCMAERLKSGLLENGIVDVIAGPDAYRDLPRLLAHNRETREQTLNVMLSADETYADVSPVRVSSSGVSAFVSIMRGCNNMCTYCVVPYTRGRERSRPIESIVEQVRTLVGQGVREVTLLGQNVNSYRDATDVGVAHTTTTTTKRDDFHTVYKSVNHGRTFAELLSRVADVDPNLRIRFTAAHPKDFPIDLLHVISERANVCSQVHLPAQSGNDRVLDVMGRGYTRATYERLVTDVQSIIPNVALTSDFIAGFCTETEPEHADTVSLMSSIDYTMAYCFAYSMRGRTRAHRRFVDDVADDVKKRRTMELHDTFQVGAARANSALIAGDTLVLVDGVSRRNANEMQGRTDGGVRAVLTAHDQLPNAINGTDDRACRPGDYVMANVIGATSHSVRAVPKFITDIVTASK